MTPRGFAFLCTLIAVFALARSARLNRPWTEGLDQMGARYSTVARNFARDGLGPLPIRQRAHTGRGPHFDAEVTTHPPLLPLLVAAGFVAAGSHDPWVARLVAMFGAAIALWLLWRLAARYASRRIAAAAGLIVVLAPASAFYGAWVDPVGWWSVAGVLAAVCAYRPWLEGDASKRTIVRVAMLVVAIVIAVAIEWNAVFLVPVFAIDSVLRARGRATRVLAGAAIALGASALLYRVVFAVGGGADPTAKLARVNQWNADFASTLLGHWVRLFGAPLTIAAAFALVALAVRCIRSGATAYDRIALMVLGLQAYYTAIYPAGSRVHDYCAIYLLVPIALLVGRHVVRLHDALRVRTSAVAAGAVTGILVGAFGLHAAYLGQLGWTEHDGPAPRIAAVARIVRDATRADEVIATAHPLDRLESIRYHADRTIVGGITTPAMLRALAATPHRGQVFVLDEFAARAYPQLAGWLDANAPHRAIDTVRIFDLRATDPAGWPPPADTPTSTTMPAPREVTITIHGANVTIDWRPPPGHTPSGYRLDVGHAAGHYPVGIDVHTPPITRPLTGDTPLHFVIAARDEHGTLGPRTPDHAFTINAVPNRTATLLAIAIAAAALATLHAALLVRGR